jgi:hypothetical protein
MYDTDTQQDAFHKDSSKIPNNGANIQLSMQQSFLFTLHVSTTMGHLQVFSVTHHFLLNYNARFIHFYLHTQYISDYTHFYLHLLWDIVST